MQKILITDPIAEAGLSKIKATPGIEADIRTGLTPAQLADIIGDYDGMIIRSGVKVTADVLANPGRLKAIARAGAGVDNVDIDAATAAGVLVMNTPDANTLSTAEHTIAMMLAAHRRIAQAHQHVASGAWNRNAYVGEQLAGKTLGIVGFGRVGRAVASRALAFEMKIIAFDPFLRSDSAMEGRVTVAQSLDDMLGVVDVLTLHAALTDDTRNIIDAARLAKMKPGAVIVNCARGGLIDENALSDSLATGHTGAAAIDVFATEPPTDSPLLRLCSGWRPDAARPGADQLANMCSATDRLVLTPHLGASTQQAQTAVSTDAVDEMLDYLLYGTIRNALNISGLPADLSERQRAYFDLTARMATILSSWCGDGVDCLEVATVGSDSLHDICPALALQALVGLMNPHISTRLTLVNARAFAQDRGIRLRTTTHAAQADYPEVVRVRFERGGESHEIEGAAFGGGRLRVLAIDGYRMEMTPAGGLVMIFNDDRPGVIGLVGTILGDARVNVADMVLSRHDKTALMVCNIDGGLDETVLSRIRDAEPILSIRSVTLPTLS